MAHGSKKVVVSAIIGNAIVTVLKFGAAAVTHSAAMTNEAVHSLMDTANQVFLLIGLIRGGRPADRQYAFGHGQKKYLWNLWSAIGLFSIGCGLGLSHAWHAYHKLELVERPQRLTVAGVDFDPVWVSVVVLLIAIVLEGYVLYIAGREYLQRMRADGHRNPFAYLAVADDSTLVAVVLEDTIAVSGVVFAAAGIGLTRLTGNPMWDIGFSVLIALMLGVTAFFLGIVNMRFLTDIRDHDAEQAFREVAARHAEVERFHDLRSIIVDESHTVVVADVELREEGMLAGIRQRIQAHERELLERVPEHRREHPQLREYVADRAAIQATLERTEQVIDELEAALRQRSPQVSHVTIEVEGIAEPATPGMEEVGRSREPEPTGS